MAKFICKHCGKAFTSAPALAGHISHCFKNPNRITSKERSEINKRARATYINNHPELYEIKSFICKCAKCGKEYTVQTTQPKFNKGEYPHYCSQSCANSHSKTEEQKKHISEIMKKYASNLKKEDKQKKYHYKTYTCKYCGKEFTMQDERNTTGRKYCSEECKTKWMREHIYDKAGGYRKGSGYGKHGWYKGIYCDSSWELAFVIFHLDAKHDIQRCTSVITYEFEGKKHTYHPDFIVDGKTYEIKGYSTSQWKAKQKASKDIIVLLKNDMKPYLNYCHDKYGNDFINLYDGSNSKKDLNNRTWLWVNNGSTNTFIKPDKWEEYKNNGWVRGRIMQKNIKN